MLLPDYIDINESEKYNLSIRIDRQNFSFTLLDTDTKAFCFVNRKFFEEVSLLENIKQSIFDMSFLTHKYASTELIFVSDSFEFVPTYIFEKKEQEAIFRLSHAECQNTIMQSQPLLKNTITLFDTDKELFNFLQRSILDIKYHHHTHILANHFYQKTRIPSLYNQGFINFDGNRCDVFFFRSQKLVHVGSYENLKEQDLVFQILSIWEKAGYKQLDDLLFVCGESPIKEKTLDILKDYIKKVEDIGIPSDAELLGADAKQTPLDLLVLSL